MRALALRDVLDRGPRDQDLREAQDRAMSSPPISTILHRQKPDGRWNGVYTPKYMASHWSNLLLVEYGADPSDPRVRRGARRILEDLEDMRGGSMSWAFPKDHGVACFSANVVRYAALAGYGGDSRLEPLVQRLAREAKKYDAACYINGDEPCAWGYARLIWGLSALPEGSRTRDVERAIRKGVEFLLAYKMERGAYPTGTKPSHLWRQLSFPLFYQADVLFALRAIDAAGSIEDSRVQPAIAWLLSRQDDRGRWGGRSPYQDRMPSRVEPSKWITLQVVTLLKHAFPEPAA